MIHLDAFNKYKGGQAEAIPTYVPIIYVLLHRLGVISRNHFNWPHRVDAGVLGLVSEKFVATFAGTSKTFKGLIN